MEIWIENDHILLDESDELDVSFDNNTDDAIRTIIAEIKNPSPKYNLEYNESEMMDMYAEGFKAGVVWALAGGVIKVLQEKEDDSEEDHDE